MDKLRHCGWIVLLLISVRAIAVPQGSAVPSEAGVGESSPKFEVATIKTSDPDEEGYAFRAKGNRFSTVNTSVLDLIEYAFGVNSTQIIAAPRWSQQRRFDLLAEANGEIRANTVELKSMIKRLLAERFGFEYHIERMTVPVYRIVAAKGGAKLIPSSTPDARPRVVFDQLGELPVRNASLGDFISVLQTLVGRPIVDETMLKGKYDFTLKWTPDGYQFAAFGLHPATPPDATAPDLFTAVHEQLGLQLRAGKAPVEVLVVERLLAPSEN